MSILRQYGGGKDYRQFDMMKRINRPNNTSGVVAPIEMYDDPLDPSKIKQKTKKIIYGFSMGLFKPNRTMNTGYRK